MEDLISFNPASPASSNDMFANLNMAKPASSQTP
jgi:hypothetical protein